MSYQQHLILTGLEGVRAKEVMMRAPETVTSDLSLQILVDDYFLHRRYQAFPVTQNGDLVGIISLNQVKETPREHWQKQTVAETMTPISDTVAVRPETPMTQVLQKWKIRA